MPSQSLIGCLLLSPGPRRCMATAVATVRRHQPLIRFPNRRHSVNNGVSQAAAAKASPSKQAAPAAEIRQPAIKVIPNWQENFTSLEARFQRRPIDEKEIEAINSGGATWRF